MVYVIDWGNSRILITILIRSLETRVISNPPNARSNELNHAQSPIIESQVHSMPVFRILGALGGSSVYANDLLRALPAQRDAVVVFCFAEIERIGNSCHDGGIMRSSSKKVGQGVLFEQKISEAKLRDDWAGVMEENEEARRE
jgi:hypothetical protein